MNMKKIAILALSLCMIAAIAVTGTIAYFTDADSQTNVFTTGNVLIDLWEDFGDNDEATIEKLMPVTYDENNKRQNAIEKEIYVTNEGTEDAYVRIHFAIPAVLDDGDPSFNASKNSLHWNFWNYGNKQWNWTADADAAGYNANNWNYYEDTIGNVEYNVYVATYETALKTNDTTPNAVWQVYLDSSVGNEQITGFNAKLGTEWKILVAAEGTQEQGFKDAYTALDTAFGKPGTYKVNWNAVTYGKSEANPNKTFENKD